MELVPIIYQMLFFIAALLIIVLAVSYIASRIKKTHLVHEEHDLVGSRITQLAYIQQRPPGNIYPVPVPIRAGQSAVTERTRQNSPNIKVIRRSSSIKSYSKEIPKNQKTKYYTKPTNIRSTQRGKQRYTVLNEELNGNSLTSIKGLTGTVENFDTAEEKYANFR